MAQCRGQTKKGDRCKRDASSGSDFCTIHIDQEVRPPQTDDAAEWDSEAIVKAAVGFAIVGVILMFGFRR